MIQGLPIRARLANRRPTERLTFEHGGKPGTVAVGFPVDVKDDGIFVAGKPGELFIEFGKAGSDVEAAARDAGLLLSIAMQHGIDLKAFQLSVTRQDDGRASSVIGAAIDKIIETYGGTGNV
jgi:hypothetical protein